MEAFKLARFAAAERIAQRFVAARMSAHKLVDYPGPIPPDLASAYECQEAAITLWQDEIAGWKVGRIAEQYEKQLGEARLVGPIFRQQVQQASEGEELSVGLFEGGFAAVEAEYLFEIGTDAPADKLRWTEEEAAALVKTMRAGIEMAGSPLASINALGPTVTVSDFGNNAGLIVGPPIPSWREKKPEELRCETFLEGKSVGRGSAANVYGGPLGALKFAAELGAKRGRPLLAGMLISTGAATGIHEIVSGQKAQVSFEDVATIQVAAKTRTGQSA